VLFRSFALRHLVSVATETFVPAAAAKGLRLTWSVDERLADAHVGDPLRLRQILSNLLSNAIKFVEAGVPPVVRIRKENRGAQARIWVEDNGIGIAPENHDRIFKVFERLHHREIYPGTGMGLAIVHRALERMGGRVGLESALGRGSRFWFELPEASPL